VYFISLDVLHGIPVNYVERQYYSRSVQYKWRVIVQVLYYRCRMVFWTFLLEPLFGVRFRWLLYFYYSATHRNVCCNIRDCALNHVTFRYLFSEIILMYQMPIYLSSNCLLVSLSLRAGTEYSQRSGREANVSRPFL